MQWSCPKDSFSLILSDLFVPSFSMFPGPWQEGGIIQMSRLWLSAPQVLVSALWPVVNLCINYPLQEDFSLMRMEGHICYGCRNTCLDGDLMLCPFSKIIVKRNTLLIAGTVWMNLENTLLMESPDPFLTFFKRQNYRKGTDHWLHGITDEIEE